VARESLTQQQELFVTLSDTDTLDSLLVTPTVPVADKFYWRTITAMVRNHTYYTVHAAAGAVTTVHMMMMFPSHVSPTRLKQLLWLEEEIHGLDVLKCFMLISGEPFVVTDSLTHQQESFATLLDSDISEER